MPELLVTVDEGEVIPFSTSNETALQLLDSGSAHLGEPPGFRSRRPSSRPSGRRASRTPEQRVELAVSENPYLVALCGGEAEQSSELSEADPTLDQLAERVASILDGRRPKPAPEVPDAVPDDAPEWFRAMFRPAA